MKRQEVRIVVLMMALISVMWGVSTKKVSAGTDFSSAQKIQVNTKVTGNVTQGSWAEKDYYKFDLSSAGSVKVTTTTPLQSDSSAYWTVSLYNSDYKEMANNIGIWQYECNESTGDGLG